MFEHYKGQSLLALYDAIGCLAEHLGDALKQPAVHEVLMPLLTKKWTQVQDSDKSLCPLFECFEAVTIALGPGIEPYAKGIFDRCIAIVRSTYYQLKESDENSFVEKEFLIRAVDLLSALFNALGAKSEQLTVGSELIMLIIELIRQEDLLIK